MDFKRLQADSEYSDQPVLGQSLRLAHMQSCSECCAPALVYYSYSITAKILTNCSTGALLIQYLPFVHFCRHQMVLANTLKTE